MKRWRGMWAMRSGAIDSGGGFWIMLALMVLLFPLRVLAGILLAAAAHELGHLLALRLCGGRIEGVSLRAWGVKIKAAPLPPARELLCILAGPAAGALTVLARNWFPELALAGLLQTGFNLLPIYPLDGGRAVRNICCKIRDFRIQ